MSFFTTANFMRWEFWSVYDPANGFFGDQKVAFDGPNKIIFVAEGVTTLNVKDDIYSAWKEWIRGNVEQPNGASWKEAISAIGGEPLNDTLNVGSTFFLENGWRIQPVPSTVPYVLTVEGNIFTREAGGNPFLFAEGVSVNLTRSNLVDQIVASSTIRDVDRAAIAADVWSYLSTNAVPTSSYGQLVQNIDSDLTVVESEVDKTLKLGEYLAFQR